MEHRWLLHSWTCTLSGWVVGGGAGWHHCSPAAAFITDPFVSLASSVAPAAGFCPRGSGHLSPNCQFQPLGLFFFFASFPFSLQTPHPLLHPPGLIQVDYLGLRGDLLASSTSLEVPTGPLRKCRARSFHRERGGAPSIFWLSRESLLPLGYSWEALRWGWREGSFQKSTEV